MADKRVVSVGGGKGGVGKSFVAVNLAVSLARLGRDVVMVDADLGGANLHTLFGIMRPERTVHDFIEGRASSLEEVAIPTAVQGLRIVSGTCEVLGSADPAGEERRRLLTALAAMDVDCLVIDVGAGTNAHTIDLFNAADTRIVVMAPELTAVQNAYGFVKNAVYRRLQRALEGHPVARMLEDRLGEQAFKTGSRMEKVETFLAVLADEQLGLDEPFRMLLRELNLKIVGNMLASDADRNVLYALKRMMATFLSVDADVSAALRTSSKVRTSVNAGKPLAMSAASGGAADYDVAELQRLARAIAEQDMRPIKKLRESIATALSSEERAFAFGLDGVEVVELVEITDPEELAALPQSAPPSAASAPPPVPASLPAPRIRRAPGAAVAPILAPLPIDRVGRARFASELNRVQRKSTRGVTHVEVECGGQWYFGKLVRVDPDSAGVVVAGVHLFFAKPGASCALRLVRMEQDEEQHMPSPVRVELGRYDDATGQTALRFSDPGPAQAFVEHVMPASPSVRPRAA